ncbi:RluA family pseudouridine synthase [Macrococcoides caseolyticum]|uniref:RluA family pseudouridine synthase n=1 Tax=Macrococcoides caseolyticum TaxID=69966 RepID=UPI001F1D1271|nr:RluA family pseudouridine synthase [Macrococcus caseolyticus]MCE4955719.1 RluA family pseudouridine synthase [Macrococcus caseolyticus]
MIQLHYLIDEATTVKAFLIDQQFSKKSLSAIKRDGALLVNGMHVTVRKSLSPKDTLEVILPPETRSPYLQESDIQVEVVYDDPYIIIANKPPNMNTIPSQLHPHDSLIEALYGYLKQMDDTCVLHPVSRLDRDTSGLVVMSKHQLFHHLLTNQIKKEYLLLCSGQVNMCGNICYPIARKHDSIIERIPHVKGQSARTEYQRIAYDSKQDISLVKATLHTGRTHQIRVHFKSLGHPLVGDTLYGKDTRLPRHALHAYAVKFKHPVTEEILFIESHLPNDLSHNMDVV